MMKSKEFIHYKDLMLHKAYADFRAEAERTYLGVAWWVLEPLVDLGIYYLIFGYFFRRNDPEFVPYLLVSIIVWRYFGTTVPRDSMSILANVNVVRQVSFRKIIFPIIAILTCSMEFIFSLILLFAFLFFWDYDITIHYAAFPVLLLMLTLIVLGVSLPLAALVPFIPDLYKLVNYILRIAFYMSAILYKVTDLPEAAQYWLQFNPMVSVIASFRDILMYRQWPAWNGIALVSLLSLLSAVFGALLIARFDPLFAKRITR